MKFFYLKIPFSTKNKGNININTSAHTYITVVQMCAYNAVSQKKKQPCFFLRHRYTGNGKKKGEVKFSVKQPIKWFYFKAKAGKKVISMRIFLR